jgi:hypothetical protein
MTETLAFRSWAPAGGTDHDVKVTNGMPMNDVANRPSAVEG